MLKSQTINEQLNSHLPITGTSRNDSPRLLIRADAGPAIGTGPILRMLSLAKSWQELTGEVAMVAGDLPGGLLKRIRKQNIAFVKIPYANGNVDDAQALMEIAGHFNPDWIALDGDRLDADYQRQLATLPARLLISNSVQAESKLNPTLALLRWNQRHESANETRRIPLRARRILIAIGPDTTENWTLSSLQAINELNRPKVVVDCLLGSKKLRVHPLIQFKLESKMNLRIHQNVDRLEALMPRIDLAITSSGNPVMELARQGVPSLVVPSTQPNRWIEKMHESGAIVLLDSERQSTLEPLQSAEDFLPTVLKKLLNDRDRRKRLSETAQQVVDGQGSIRLAREMAATVTFSQKKSA